jgi:hypothetical protein
MSTRFASALIVVALCAGFGVPHTVYAAPAAKGAKESKKAKAAREAKEAEEAKQAKEAEEAKQAKEAEEAKQAEEQKADEAKKADEEQANKKAEADADHPSADENAKPASDADASSPIEERGKSYKFVGLRYRGVIVPKFMINLFGQGGRTVYVNGIGPEFTVRKDNFEYVFALWYAAYSMDPTAFKSKSDVPQAWEIVQSRIKVLYLTSDFLWSHDFNPQFAVNYGLGAGLGIVWGDLFRTQAYPGANANLDTGDGFLPCRGVGDPRMDYCANDNNHYPGYTEPSWAGGGSKPIIFPWFAIQTGLRYKAHRNFVARLDAGFGTSGFFFGLGADYGL